MLLLLAVKLVCVTPATTQGYGSSPSAPSIDDGTFNGPMTPLVPFPSPNGSDRHDEKRQELQQQQDDWQQQELQRQ